MDLSDAARLLPPDGSAQEAEMPEWYVSSLMMERALDAVVRRVRKLDRKHDIPYLAGYSLDGKTIYIDRHMPRAFKFRGRTVETDRFLILHEEVEKTLIDQLGLHYLHAHQIATRAEEAAVRASGIKWRDYDRFMQKHVKTIGDERGMSCCGRVSSPAARPRPVRAPSSGSRHTIPAISASCAEPSGGKSRSASLGTGEDLENVDDRHDRERDCPNDEERAAQPRFVACGARRPLDSRI